MVNRWISRSPPTARCWQRKAAALKAAGLKRITVSLDAIDDDVFRRMNDVDFSVEDVLVGHRRRARAAGFAPVKVNMVVKKGTNDDQVVPLTRALHARYGQAPSCCVSSSSWTSARPTAGGWTTCCPRTTCSRACKPWSVALTALAGHRPRARRPSAGASTTAGQEIGLVSSVTQAFCGQLQSRAAVDRRPALPVPFRVPGPRPASAAARRRGRRRRSRPPSITSGPVATTVIRRSAVRRRPRPRAGKPATGQRRVEMHYIGG